jgi:tetratricopeptide (TPR) repeat protein
LASDEEYAVLLREKPNDASTHCNYGDYLRDRKNDLEGAEKAYRKALEIDDKHVNALGNLANVLWAKKDLEGARALYERALEIDPGNENVSFNFARFLLKEFSDTKLAAEIARRASEAHPDSGRLLLLSAEFAAMRGDYEPALRLAEEARTKNAEQKGVEAIYAVALHRSGGATGECIAAYRTALSLAPDDGALRLNLAQLLFIRGDDLEAMQELNAAARLKLDPSARLEEWFYRLAHATSDAPVLLDPIKSHLAQGARLNWNVETNIERVRQGNPKKAEALDVIAQVMRGKRSVSALDEAVKALC